jgi:hypothetical protein
VGVAAAAAAAAARAEAQNFLSVRTTSYIQALPVETYNNQYVRQYGRLRRDHMLVHTQWLQMARP